MYLHKFRLNILKKKWQEKWEKAYLTVKNAYRLIYLQTKPKEEIYKTTDSLILRKEILHLSKMARIFHIETEYFVIYPHKCALKIEEKYQENGRMHIYQLKMKEIPGEPTRQYWLASLTLFRFAMWAKSRKHFLCPPWRILDPLVRPAHYQSRCFLALWIIKALSYFVLFFEDQL